MLEVTKPGADIGIMVADEAGQRRFYGEALDLPYFGEVALPNGKLHIYGCGDTLLKLYVLPGVLPRPPATGPQVGLAYFTINVRDVRSAVARLEAHRVAVQPIGEFDAGVSLQGPVGRVKALYAMTADADGNSVELLQRRR
jgi:catechol 2,3-dioxygenase-like lactoylglutathione lyase family enzyme